MLRNRELRKSSNHDAFKIIDKSSIKVVFYSFHLNVNFYRKTTPEQFNELTCQICSLDDSLNYDRVYYEEIYFDICLVKPKNKNSKRRPKCGACRQTGARLGDVTEDGRPVLRGREVILQILRLGGHFCGDHGVSAPPPSLSRLSRNTYCTFCTSVQIVPCRQLWIYSI